MLPLPLDELVMQQVQSLGIRAHLFHMRLAAATKDTKDPRSIGKRRTLVRCATKDNAADTTNDALPIFAGEYLTIHNEVFDNEAAHAVSDEENGAVTSSQRWRGYLRRCQRVSLMIMPCLPNPVNPAG